MEPQAPQPTQKPQENSNDPTVPTVSSVSSQNVYPPPNNIYPPQPVVVSQISDLPKKRNKWLYLVFALVILILAAGSLLLYTKNKNSNQPTQGNNQASIPSVDGGIALTAQAYQNKGYSYKLKFYSGSTVETDSQSDGTSNLLVSPALKNNGLPIEISIIQGNDAATLQAFEHNKNCPGATITAFTVHITSANTDAKVCSTVTVVKAKQETYLVSYKNNGFVYEVTVRQRFDVQKAKTDTQYAIEVSQKVNLQPYQSDLKIILSSLQPQT